MPKRIKHDDKKIKDFANSPMNGSKSHIKRISIVPNPLTGYITESEKIVGEMASVSIHRKDDFLYDPESLSYNKYHEHYEFSIKDLKTNDVIGHISMKFIPDEGHYEENVLTATRAYLILHLIRVFINEQHRNKGYGTDIVKVIIRWAKRAGFQGIEIFGLPEDKDIDWKIKFFEKCGFMFNKDNYPVVTGWIYF